MINILNNRIKESCKSQKLFQEIGSLGNINGKIAIVLDNPSITDVKTQGYFSGKYCESFIKDLFRYVPKNEIYVTSAVKRYEQLSADGHKKIVKNSEFQYWKQILLYELKELKNCKYILCMGSLASQCFQDYNTLAEIRGSYTEYEDKIVFHMNNPNAFMRDLKMIDINKMDLEKFGKVYNGEREPVVNYIINPTYETAINYIEDCKHKEVALDIETNDNKVSCFSLAYKVDEGICIPLHSNSKFSDVEKQNIINKLKELFSCSRIICHNAMFDLIFLNQKDGLQIPIKVADTMLYHNYLYEHLPHKLAFLCSVYTMFNFYKDELNNWKVNKDVNRFFVYNIKDSIVTLICYKKFCEKFESCEMITPSILANINDRLIDNLLIFSKGVLINRGYIRKYENDLIKEYRNHFLKVRDYFPELKIENPKKLTDKFIKDKVVNLLGIKIKRKGEKIFNILNEALSCVRIYNVHNEIIYSLLFIIGKRKQIKCLSSEKVLNDYHFFNMNFIKKDSYPTYIECRDTLLNQNNSIIAKDGKKFIGIKWINKPFNKLCELLKDNKMFNNDIVKFKEILNKEIFNFNQRANLCIEALIDHGYKPFNAENFKGLPLNGSEIQFMYNKFHELFPEIKKYNEYIIKTINKINYISCENMQMFKHIKNSKDDRFIEFVYNCEVNNYINVIARKNVDKCIYYDNNMVIFEVDIDDNVLPDVKYVHNIFGSNNNKGTLSQIMDNKITEIIDYNKILK